MVEGPHVLTAVWTEEPEATSGKMLFLSAFPCHLASGIIFLEVKRGY